MNIKKKRWLLTPTKKNFGDLAREKDERDKSPWDPGQRSEKPYQSGATGPSIVNEGDKSYPSNSSGETYLKRYLGTPGQDYDTQPHND